MKHNQKDGFGRPSTVSANRPRHVLVVVAGVTPQIITETIYALGTGPRPVDLDTVYIVTTTVGRAKAQENLIQRGILLDLIKEYGLKPIDIRDDSFVMTRDGNGNELADITNDDDNRAVGDLITTLVRDLTSDPATVLHCSIAGGRKTMGFYLGAALQLFGRPADKLYHVLVSPEFESNPEFYYPPKRPAMLESRDIDGTVRRLNTRDAKVQLAELPFIRHREKLSLEGQNFSELIKKGQRQVDTAVVQPELTVDLAARIVRIDGHVIEMAPVLILFYTMLLLRKVENCLDPHRKTCRGCRRCFVEVSELSSKGSVRAMAALWERIFPNRTGKGEDFLARWKDGMRQETVRQYIAKIKRAIEAGTAGRPFVPFCTVTGDRRWGSSTYGIDIERRNIRIR